MKFKYSINGPPNKLRLWNKLSLNYITLTPHSHLRKCTTIWGIILIPNISTPNVYFFRELCRVISKIRVKISFIFTATGWARQIKETSMTAQYKQTNKQILSYTEFVGQKDLTNQGYKLVCTTNRIRKVEMDASDM